MDEITSQTGTAGAGGRCFGFVFVLPVRLTGNRSKSEP
jgi:hypothetical protein